MSLEKLLECLLKYYLLVFFVIYQKKEIFTNVAANAPLPNMTSIQHFFCLVCKVPLSARPKFHEVQVMVVVLSSGVKLASEIHIRSYFFGWVTSFCFKF